MTYRVITCAAALMLCGPCITAPAQAGRSAADPVALQPSTYASAGKVEKRYQSFNLEMVEVMGGKWWGPYANAGESSAATDRQLSLTSSSLQNQPPIDLYDPRLRKLTRALGPTYLRVSDTWTNTMFFQDSMAKDPGPAPKGFQAVLTGPQWKGVLDFTKSTDAQLITSFSIAAGLRDASGVWTPVEADKLLRFTREQGGQIAGAEFFNEPNLAAIGGAPKGYDAAAYGRDFRVFENYMKDNAPQVKILGPGPIGEGKTLGDMPAGLKTEDLLKAGGPGLDVFTYHFYGAVSQRCVGLGPSLQTTREDALSQPWLFATEDVASFYKKLRDQFQPGIPLWLSETADAACGGNPWSSTFVDTFRYLNQLGILARTGVSVSMHNTLIGSDYGLIDRKTMQPRANYWAAVLWSRLMGSTVLDAGVISPAPNLYVYAHCSPAEDGGVTVLAINADVREGKNLILPMSGERFTLQTASPADLQSPVSLNGSLLEASSSGEIPNLKGEAQHAGNVTLMPASITFFKFTKAQNKACR